KTAVLIVAVIALVIAALMLVGWIAQLRGLSLSDTDHKIKLFSFKSEPTPDPHEGQVYINDGFGMTWMTPLEGVDVSTLKPHDFSYSSGKLSYIGGDFDVLRGVDVSEHQHEIDWNAVKASGIDFAFIRAGYRGYTEGGIFKDAFANRNLRDAHDAGLKVGVYFFSQAISPEEAREEAQFVLNIIENYEIDLPVIYDWEKIEDTAEARTNDLPSEVLDECAIAFCEEIKAAGYDAGVYFNRHLGYYRYDLSKLTDYYFWVAV
ncbi:MAG: GH25 family lysozyme, partial [Clostridia bacterium]|nr:GH25 family lysozyme [Clostridia bacterium]